VLQTGDQPESASGAIRSPNQDEQESVPKRRDPNANVLGASGTATGQGHGQTPSTARRSLNRSTRPFLVNSENASDKSQSTSKRKIEANQRNALQSTGPKTPSGKRAVRFNALKHGFFVKEVLTLDPDDQSEIRRLVARLRAYWEPVGGIEELLVEKIALCFWKARRAVRSEYGHMIIGTLKIGRGVHSSDFVDAKIRLLEDARKEIVKHGKLPVNSAELIKRLFGNNPFIAMRLVTQESFDGPARKEALAKIDSEILSLRIDSWEAKAREESEREAAELPGVHETDLILRYEAANDRELYRALDRLERVQRQRKGEYVPAPVRVSLEGPG
jgi:hypothetical protein